MKFAITNENHSYEYDEEESPPAFLKLSTLVDGYVVEKRTTDDPRKIPFYDGKPDEAMKMWFGSGERHRVVDGWITKDEPRQFYMIDFNDFNELNTFMDSVVFDLEIENKKSYRYGEEYIRVLHIKDGW